jgi:hypothetical protein
MSMFPTNRPSGLRVPLSVSASAIPRSLRYMSQSGPVGAMREVHLHSTRFLGFTRAHRTDLMTTHWETFSQLLRVRFSPWRNGHVCRSSAGDRHKSCTSPGRRHQNRSLIAPVAGSKLMSWSTPGADSTAVLLHRGLDQRDDGPL